MGVIRTNPKLRTVESGASEHEDFTIVPNSPEIDEVIPRFNSLTIRSSPAGYALPHSLLTESLDSELDAIVYTLQQNNQLQRRKPKTKKLLTNPRPEPTFRSLGCKGKSHHKYRRFENANFLGKSFPSELVDDDDLCRALSIYDFMPETLTSLDQLFLNPPAMEFWQDFISLPESEQERLLESLDDDSSSDNSFNGTRKYTTKRRKNRNLKQKSDLKEQVRAMESKRLSGKQCFERIDTRLKTIIRKNSVPLSLLEQIESDLIQVFQDDPNSIYQCCLDSSYDRFILRACAQYHNLSCHSFDRDGDRWSQVKNKTSNFDKPLISLHLYLDQLYQNRTDNE